MKKTCNLYYFNWILQNLTKKFALYAKKVYICTRYILQAYTVTT